MAFCFASQWRMNWLGWAVICSACGVDQLTMGSCLRSMIPVMATACVLCLASAGTHGETGRSGAGVKWVPLAAGTRAEAYAKDEDAGDAGGELLQRHSAPC